MTSIFYWKKTSLYFGLCFYSAAIFADADIRTYRNIQYGFSFSYPSSWVTEAPRAKNGVIKISSDHGNGDAGCNVVVTSDLSIKGWKTRDVVSAMTPKTLLAELAKGGITDAVVVESGLTEIFNRDAHFAVLSYTIRTMGVVIPVKTLQVVTTKNELIYTFSCGTADPSSFQTMYPTFRGIIGTLLISP